MEHQSGLQQMAKPAMTLKRRSQARARWGLRGLFVLAATLFVGGVRADAKADPADPWPSITPNEKLEWHPCYKGSANISFFCARLTVPMDYEAPESAPVFGAKVHIAMVLRPSTQTTQSIRNARSPLLINPGGPGGSGVQIVLSAGDAIQAILGGDQDVIGFDPRGVAATTPRADCWTPLPTECRGGVGNSSSSDDACEGPAAVGYSHRMQFTNAVGGVGLVNSSNVALTLLDAGGRAINQLCRDKDGQAGGASILRYAATPFVARDMLSIVDAWDAWQETLAVVDNSKQQTPTYKDKDDEERREELKRDLDSRSTRDPDGPPSTKGKLVYWGFSYGSYLGSTFAKLFPDRVGRVAIDGVLDPYQYGSPLWKDSLHNTDDGLRNFFRYCFEAGAKCRFRHDGDASLADVEKRFWSLMDRLAEDPPILTIPDSQVPVVVTPGAVKRLVFRSLYSPIQLFPMFVDPLLSVLHEGRPEELGAVFRGVDLDSMCDLSAVPHSQFPHDASRAVLCGDKRDPMDDTVAELEAKFKVLGETSYFADVWMDAQMMCNKWGMPAAHHHRSLWDPAEDKVTATAFPLLILSNTHDPVTPLVSALRMSTAFKGPGFVEQRSGGHCTISAASSCTARILRDYFVDGKVPPPPGNLAAGSLQAGHDDYLKGNWTVCEVEEWPWRPRATAGTAAAGEGGDEMAKVLDQLKVVREALGSLRDQATGRQEEDVAAAGIARRLRMGQHVL